MKINQSKGKQVASAVLAGVLAMGMCVPAVSFSALVSPGVAIAANSSVSAATNSELSISNFTYDGSDSHSCDYVGELNVSSTVSGDDLNIKIAGYGGDSYCPPDGAFRVGFDTDWVSNVPVSRLTSTDGGYIATIKLADIAAAYNLSAGNSVECKLYLSDYDYTVRLGSVSFTLTATAAAPVEKTYSLNVTKDSSRGGVVAFENNKVMASYDANQAGDTAILNYFKVGEKTAMFDFDPNHSDKIIATIDVSDLGVGTHPFSVYGTDDTNGTELEGTLVISTPTTPITLALKTPGASARMTSDATLATGTSYTAIKVFDADITGKYGDENAPKGTNIKFANGVTADVIKAAGDPDFLDDVDTAHRDLTNAQNAAEYLNANITHQPGVGLAASDYGMALAKRLIAAGADTKTIVADGDKVQLDGEGYYLIVKTDDLNGENTAATSPIFAALDEGDNEITLKVAIPTITKEIQEDDETGTWGDEADHTLNQAVNYRLIGTIAENVDAFATYEYNFKDSWDATKLALHADSVKVVVKTADTINEADGSTVPGTEINITDAVRAGIKTDTNGELQVNIADLKAVYPALVATDQVIVTYTAEQCGTTASPEGIINTAKLEYANNPVFASKGTTPEVSVKDYSYALKIHKVDNSTNESLEGVEFSIKNTAGKYLALVDDEVVEQDEAYAWVTDADGRIVVDGVDADTYTVAETKALDSYDKIDADILVSFDATDRDAVVNGLQSTTDLVKADDEATAANGVNQIVVANVKQIPLPSTGEMGIALVIFLAVAAGIYAVSRRRKQEEARTLVI